MSYEQHYTQPRQQQYPQSRQLQYYEQWRHQQGQEQHTQYASPSHGPADGRSEQVYDHGGGWDQRHYDQQDGWHGEPQHGYADADSNQYAEHEQYQQQHQHQQHHQQPYQQNQQRQPQRQDPRSRPTDRMKGPPSNATQSRNGLRPPGLDRSLLNPVQPKSLPQDNPFPTFPAQKPKQHMTTDSITQGMSQMAVRDGAGRDRSQAHSGPQAMATQQQSKTVLRHDRPDGNNRQDSGHFEDNGQHRQHRPARVASDQRPAPVDSQASRGLPSQHRSLDPKSPSQRAFGPDMQRSATMPQNLPSEGRRPANAFQQQQQQQWVEPGAVSGHRAALLDSTPPRPSTAGGSRSNAGNNWHQQRPPVPQMPQQRPHQQGQNGVQAGNYQEEEHGVLDNFYDDYYEDTSDRKSMASTVDMPNFDAIPDTNSKHRRGDSIDNHLSPSSGPSLYASRQEFSSSSGPVSNDHLQRQASRSQSQPNIHEEYTGGVYETAVDAPPVPGLPRANTGFMASQGHPRGYGPPTRAMTLNDMHNGPTSQDCDQGYHSQQRPSFDPRYGRQDSRAQRMYSDESVYSEPPPNSMRNISTPIDLGQAMQRPGTAAPATGRMPSDPVGRRPGTSQALPNPNSLPAHPQPVRPGLMQQVQQQQQIQQSQTSQQARPPPIRQYNSEPGRTSYDSGAPSVQRQNSSAHPVTHDELNRLRNTLKSNPSDIATGLKLVKKLVEAANVLSDEGGTADTRTKNKNREKFILEAHKMVKKLVSGGSPDAMFYLADCYGQGLLGLQVDTKEAFNLYQSAAKGGHAASAYRTAVCCEMGHEEGGGTKRDPLKAVQWYRRAAALGDTPALYKMGMILLKGLLGQQRNFGEAINMLKRAAERADRDNPHALHELALIYESQTGNERIIPDEAYALQLFHQAADLGYKFSQFRLGQAYEYGLLGCQIDARTSIAWYTKAAAQEEHQSELALSGWYLTGTSGILEQSDTEAYLWARKAACAEPPLPKALFAMGYFTEVGIGCPRSLDEAKRWYGRAAAYKFPKAQERLEELKRGGSKAQMKRERLSRTNQKQQEENCNVM